MVRLLALGVILCSVSLVSAACSGPLKPLCSLIDAIKRFMAKLAPQNLRLNQVSVDTPVSSVSLFRMLPKKDFNELVHKLNSSVILPGSNLCDPWTLQW
jgi:hypothetical protein